jgi:hypothetical protein
MAAPPACSTTEKSGAAPVDRSFWGEGDRALPAPIGPDRRDSSVALSAVVRTRERGRIRSVEGMRPHRASPITKGGVPGAVAPELIPPVASLRLQRLLFGANAGVRAWISASVVGAIYGQARLESREGSAGPDSP